MSLKNSNDTIGNRTRDLPVYSVEEAGKGGRCVGLTTLPLSCADYPEIWELQTSGTFRAGRRIRKSLAKIPVRGPQVDNH